VEFLVPSLRRASLEVLRNGANEVLLLRGLPTNGFRLEDGVPHPGAFLRVPGRGSSQGPPPEVPALTSRSFPSGRMLVGVFRSFTAEQPLGPPSTEVSFGSPRRSPSGDRRRFANVVSSFGAAPQRHPAHSGNRLVTSTPSHSADCGSEYECSIASWWQHRETNHGRLLRRLRSCGSVEMKGAGRVSADARRATVRCPQQVSGSAAGRVPVRQPPSA